MDTDITDVTIVQVLFEYYVFPKSFLLFHSVIVDVPVILEIGQGGLRRYNIGCDVFWCVALEKGINIKISGVPIKNFGQF